MTDIYVDEGHFTRNITVTRDVSTEIEVLLVAARTAAEGIRMYLDGEWDGNWEGWEYTRDLLLRAIRAVEAKSDAD